MALASPMLASWLPASASALRFSTTALPVTSTRSSGSRPSRATTSSMRATSVRTAREPSSPVRTSTFAALWFEFANRRSSFFGTMKTRSLTSSRESGMRSCAGSPRSIARFSSRTGSTIETAAETPGSVASSFSSASSLRRLAGSRNVPSSWPNSVTYNGTGPIRRSFTAAKSRRTCELGLK